GCDLVFVLGDPAYYGQFGFRKADYDRLPTPHPIPDHYRPGWMVQSIGGKPVDAEHRQLVCAEALNKPEFWSDGP
ncbi:MAG: GNAT family N-acetyltransferase, partial [Pseudomonadota bacterium]